MPPLTPAQQQALAHRQRVESMVGADKKLTEHLASVWAVEDSTRERDRRVCSRLRTYRLSGIGRFLKGDF